MTETLEPLLNMLCKSVTKGQQNAQQTLYVLSDAKGAKLSYDVLIACGLDVKYFADTDEAGGKLYVQNAAIAASGDKISAALAAAPLLKQIKELVDAQSTISNYNITFANTPAGRQLTLLFPSDKPAQSTSSAATKIASAAAKAASRPSARPVKEVVEILTL